jgi:hypothetical protein
MIAALYRGLSINNIIVAANTGDISKHYSTAIFIDWTLSGMLLLMVAVWILFLSGELRKFNRRAWLQAVFIGLSITIFGASLWYHYPGSIRLAVFMFIGLLLLVPLIIYVGKFRAP